jgi:hypothetical protein
MLYIVTFTIHIPPMLAYIPYMDPMGISSILQCFILVYIVQIHMSQDLNKICFLYCDFYDVLLTFI